jgi:hypothetical protein
MHVAQVSVALVVGGWLCLGLVNGCEAERSPSPAPGAQQQQPQPENGSPAAPDLPPMQPPGTAISGGQTGSGGVPMGFQCDKVAPDFCERTLRSGFGSADTPLTLAASECVPASAIDPALDAVPVCRCNYVRPNYFSDTGGTFDVVQAIGLTRRRTLLGEPNDGCEAWLDGTPASEVCLLESPAFAGCSLDAAASSCQSTCQAFSQSYSRAVSERRVEVAASSCVTCERGGSYCAGVLRSGAGCYFGLATSLGYRPRSISCDGTPEELLLRELNGSEYVRRCPFEDGAPACELVPGASCLDGGVPAPEDAGVVASDPAAADAAVPDAG